jgi:CDP-diglyceride synthetase
VCHKISSEERIRTRPKLSVLALASFILSFAAARAFTALSPRTILVHYGLHIHHFWFGLILLVVGGWLGISYENERIDRVAAILFGAGGGLVADEVGLLLTFRNYWTSITYTLVIILVMLAIMLILITTYWRVIREEFTEFSKSSVGLYSGIFLAVISIAFLIDTRNTMIIAAFGLLAIVACAIILAYFVQLARRKR